MALVKTYDPTRACPKCGNDFVTSRHVTFVYLLRPDVVRRTCERCGFAWDETPLDRAGGKP